MKKGQPHGLSPEIPIIRRELLLSLVDVAVFRRWCNHIAALPSFSGLAGAADFLHYLFGTFLCFGHSRTSLKKG